MKKKIILITTIPIIMLMLLYGVNLKYKEKEIKENKPLNEKRELLAYTCEECETLPSTFPKKGQGYVGLGVTCTNGATADWDNETWDVDFTNLVIPTACTVDFTPLYNVTATAPNGTVIGSPKEVAHGGLAAFQVTPNANYEYSSLSNCTGGSYDTSTNVLTINNVTSNIACQVNFALVKRTVTVTASNGTVTGSPKQVSYGGTATFTITPNTGYAYSSNTCGGTVSGNTLTIPNVTANKTCSVTFVIPTLYAKILADNPNVSTRSSFSGTFTTSNNGNTIYSATGQDNKTTYYFAGNVTNNYVYFAGLYWRIVRINEDNSVRLIYAGTSVTDTAGFSSTSQAFNSSYYGSFYVGYKYTSGSQYGLDTNSAIKTHLDSWYTSNLNSSTTVDGSGNKYDKYISRTAIYCNDRTVGEGTWSSSGSSGFYYAAYTRLLTNKAPTYVCSQLNDRFTTSTTTGNGRLYNSSGVESPIGTITADEVAYAGGLYGTNNRSYYIYQNASSGAKYWWTMSPHAWYANSAVVWNVGGSSIAGRLHNDYVDYTNGVRPVLSLKSCVNWSSGSGTASSPYQVSLSSACSSTIN